MTTTTNVPGFIAQYMSESMHAAGVQSGPDKPDVHVSAEVREFFVTETSQYRGVMSLLVTVRDNSGKELWSGIVLGGADNFGRSYRADNYYEAFSNMIIRATYNLLANPSFRQALPHP